MFSCLGRALLLQYQCFFAACPEKPAKRCTLLQMSGDKCKATTKLVVHCIVSTLTGSMTATCMPEVDASHLERQRHGPALCVAHSRVQDLLGYISKSVKCEGRLHMAQVRGGLRDCRSRPFAQSLQLFVTVKAMKLSWSAYSPRQPEQIIWPHGKVRGRRKVC